MSFHHLSLAALGQSFREARLQRGMRQIDVATIAALPRLKVLQVEAGKPSVSVDAYAKVAAAVGCQLQLAPAHRPTLEELGTMFDDQKPPR